MLKLVAAIFLALLSLVFLLNRSKARSRARALARLDRVSRENDSTGIRRHSLVRNVFFHSSQDGDRPTAGPLRRAYDRSGTAIGWGTVKLLVLAGFIVLPAAAYLATGVLFAIPVGALAALAVPVAVLGAVRRRNASRSREQTDALASDLSLYLRCGVPLTDALKLCSQDCGSSVLSPLAMFDEQIRLGASHTAALQDLVKTLANPDIELIAQAVLASRETGADVSAIMTAIGDALRERAAVRRELDSQTVQGRLSGMVVTALPFLFLALSFAVSRNTVRVLLTTTPGLIMLAGAAVLDLLGFLWIRRILKIGS